MTGCGSRILWINPVGTDLYDQPIAEALRCEARPDTLVDVASLPGAGPQHLEYNAYGMLVAALDSLLGCRDLGGDVARTREIA